MSRYRPHALLLLLIVVAVIAAVFSHGLRVRLLWGACGFLAGVVCGVLLTMELSHRRRRRAGR